MSIKIESFNWIRSLVTYNYINGICLFQQLLIFKHFNSSCIIVQGLFSQDPSRTRCRIQMRSSIPIEVTDYNTSLAYDS